MKRWFLAPALLATACSVQVLNPQLGSNNAVQVKDSNIAVEANAAGTVVVPPAGGTSKNGSSPVGSPLPSAGSPAPTASAVPQPSPSPTPTPDPRYAPPAFSAVRSFSSSAVYEVRDFSTIIVADGTTLHTTADAGATWKTYTGVGSQPIRSMSWLDAAHGWVVGTSGALLEVTIADGVAQTLLLDPGAQYFPYAVHFSSGTDGFIACSNNGQLARSSDGGKTWGSPVTVGGIGPGLNGFSESAFLPSGDQLAFRTRYGKLFLYQAGAFVEVQPPSMIAPETFVSVSGRAFVGDKDGGGNVFTDDGSRFTSISRDVKTATQIHRSKLKRVYPITAETWLGVVWGMWEDGAMSLTRDAGKSWMELSSPVPEYSWIRAFSEDQLWALRNNTLYRAGVPTVEQ